jgi:hypothetical protein
MDGDGWFLPAKKGSWQVTFVSLKKKMFDFAVQC